MSSISDAIACFLQDCPQRASHIDFPLMEPVGIPTANESKLVKALGESAPVSLGEIEQLRSQITVRESYWLLVFTLRMAVLAVRTTDARVLKSALLGAIIDDDVLDWRDVLIALSLLEYCAKSLGVDLPAEFGELVTVASLHRRATIALYFRRPSDWRTPEIMGYRPDGQGTSFSFKRKDAI